MRVAPLLLVLAATSCGGAVDQPAGDAVPPPRPVVIHGQLKGETVDCGISGPSSCYHPDPEALEVWLLAVSEPAECRTTYPGWCSLDERRPLARAAASFDGRFTLTTTEGDYRIAVVYRGSLRPVWTARGTQRTDSFHLTPELLTAEEVFHFLGNESAP